MLTRRHLGFRKRSSWASEALHGYRGAKRRRWIGVPTLRAARKERRRRIRFPAVAFDSGRVRSIVGCIANFIWPGWDGEAFFLLFGVPTRRWNETTACQTLIGATSPRSLRLYASAPLPLCSQTSKTCPGFGISTFSKPRERSASASSVAGSSSPCTKKVDAGGRFSELR